MNPNHYKNGQTPYPISNVINRHPKHSGSIVHQLEAEFSAPRDYREVVPEPKPEDYYPDEIKEFIECLAKIHEQAYTPKWKEIKESQLKQVNGLLQVDYKKNEIG